MSERETANSTLHKGEREKLLSNSTSPSWGFPNVFQEINMANLRVPLPTHTHTQHTDAHSLATSIGGLKSTRSGCLSAQLQQVCKMEAPPARLRQASFLLDLLNSSRSCLPCKTQGQSSIKKAMLGLGETGRFYELVGEAVLESHGWPPLSSALCTVS